MGKRDSIERLGEVLEKSLKRLDPSGKLGEYGVWPIWNEMVGDTIARNAQPEKIRQGTLFVKVSSHVWMQQLQYMKDTIADKLNQSLGGEVVKNIFFYVGEVAMPALAKPGKLPAVRVAEPPPSLDEATLSSVGDPEIRRGLRKLFAARARRAKD